MSPAEFRSVQPVLPVRDVRAAIEYYTSRLGFRLAFQDSAEDPRYAGLVRGGAEIHVQWHAMEDWGFGDCPQLRFVVPDVDALFEEYEPQGVFHEQTALRDTAWGTREFAFYDPDRNGLFFYRDL